MKHVVIAGSAILYSYSPQFHFSDVLGHMQPARITNHATNELAEVINETTHNSQAIKLPWMFPISDVRCIQDTTAWTSQQWNWLLLITERRFEITTCVLTRNRSMSPCFAENTQEEIKKWNRIQREQTNCCVRVHIYIYIYIYIVYVGTQTEKPPEVHPKNLQESRSPPEVHPKIIPKSKN